MLPRIYYHLSHYLSHRRAAHDYIGALEYGGFELTERPENADIIIVHDDPLNYPIILKDIHSRFWSAGRKSRPKFIAYAVWETLTLPDAYIGPLGLFDEIWTASTFARQSFMQRFAHVKVVPHIVNRPKVSLEDFDFLKQKIDYSRDLFYFYTITDAVNPRKNFPTLLKCFLKVFGRPSFPVRLIVKQHRYPFALDSLPNMISLNEELSDSQIFALHKLGNCYLSAHHCEAWGLPLSEAMACGRPVIATGYSGNMDFMDSENSFPVDYTITSVSQEMTRLIPLFTEEMTWADIDPGHFASLMEDLWKGKIHLNEKEIARSVLEKFSLEKIAMLLKQILL